MSDSGPDDWDASDAEESWDAPAASVTAAPKANNFADEDEEEVPVETVKGGKYAGLSVDQLVAELEKRDKEGPQKPSTGAKARRKALKDKEAAEKAARLKAEAEKPVVEELSAEEIYAQKMNVQKKVEDADLEIAKELMGDGADEEAEVVVLLIEAMDPKTKDDFNKMKSSIVNKVSKYEASPFYQTFVQDMARDLCLAMSIDDVKKCASTLEVLRSTKQKALKGKAKKVSKHAKISSGGKGGGSTRGDSEYGAYGANEYEDFM